MTDQHTSSDFTVKKDDKKTCAPDRGQSCELRDKKQKGELQEDELRYEHIYHI